jgi:hypothetical protein
MINERAAPETNGVSVEVLATVDLGPEIESLVGRQLRMRVVTIEPGGVFGPIHDHKDRPGIVYVLQGTITDHRNEVATALWAGSGLARGQDHHPLAREPRIESGDGDLGRYSQARTRIPGTGRAEQRAGRQTSAAPHTEDTRGGPVRCARRMVARRRCAERPPCYPGSAGPNHPASMTYPSPAQWRQRVASPSTICRPFVTSSAHNWQVTRSCQPASSIAGGKLNCTTTTDNNSSAAMLA